MNKCARYEGGDYCSHEFDYQTDFIQFLEEARKNADQLTSNTAHLEETRKRHELLDHGKKKKKSLKKSLFSWLKTDKKRNKPIKQPSNDVSKTRGGHFSGPVEATIDGVIRRARRAASGPLVHFSKLTKEHEVPYMCLDQPQKLQSYGPIYLVT